MKIFGVGLSRTGTTSFVEATRILGFKTCHELHGGDINYIDYIFDFVVFGSLPDELDEYDAFFDLPIPFIYKDLYKEYKDDAYFILTTRNIDDWMSSIENHCRKISKNIVLNKVLNKFSSMTIDVPSLLRLLMYGSCNFNYYKYYNAFINHHKKVITTIPEKQLLIIDIAEENKWEKLCNFLSVDIPEVDFPWLNARNTDD